eukprot:5454543-Pleurochrysis_carterae.AAC.1
MPVAAPAPAVTMTPAEHELAELKAFIEQQRRRHGINAVWYVPAPASCNYVWRLSAKPCFSA